MLELLFPVWSSTKEEKTIKFAASDVTSFNSNKRFLKLTATLPSVLVKNLSTAQGHTAMSYRGKT